MSLASVITTAAANLGISKREAAKLAAKHGRWGLVKTLNALADVLDGRRLSGSTLGALPTALAKTLSSAIDRRVHGQPKPPVIQPGAGGGSIFRTRPAPQTVADRMNQPPRPGEDGGWSEEVTGFTSSNIHAFRYFREAGAKTGILQVAYRSHVYNPAAISVGSKKHRGRDTLAHQMTGTLGSTIKGGERGGRGVTYHYRGVPPALFASMKAAASKGKWIWRELRVIGQIHGGQFPYSVVQADLNMPSGGGYLPRRAVAAQGGGTAFRTRSLAEVGSGERGFISSTLPPSSNRTGFRSRSAPGKRGR